ncbi:MAG: peptide chain release factor N(5)-glutamine methyltransferase [Candidatus Omnitrophota bacterium]|nr:MAG: peptide chain release factor N(5)-glutamine methyltransferase [Candidatus Omnitrophota bacterium]
MKLKGWLDSNRGVFSDSDLRFIIKNFFSDSPLSVLEDNTFLDEKRHNSLEKIKNLYLRKIPLAYILGKEEFYGLEFKVNFGVLIPRKETELVVEAALKIIEDNICQRILDLGCGCGNIAISIGKSSSRRLKICALDISSQALAAAQRNVKFYGSSIKLIQSDLFEEVKQRQFDLIVTNPPYVESKDIRGSLKYEPRIALDAGDGLDLIKKILLQAPPYLRGEGYLIMEIGYNQRRAVNNLIKGSGRYKIINWIKDYDNNWRGVILKLWISS